MQSASCTLLSTASLFTICVGPYTLAGARRGVSSCSSLGWPAGLPRLYLGDQESG